MTSNSVHSEMSHFEKQTVFGLLGEAAAEIYLRENNANISGFETENWRWESEGAQTR